MALRRSRYYLGEAFVVEHRPLQAMVRATAILLLPPLGYEDTCAYRPLRVLADALAEQGHLVLRLDWPGLGDSAQDDRATDLIGRCQRAVLGAAQSLRARGFSRVAGLGVRAGALLALSVECLDECALWALPLRGKGYLREERAFHKMAAAAYGKVPLGTARLPEGSVEAGGFCYSSATVAALEALDASILATKGKFRRVLLVDRDGARPAPDLMQAFAAGGAEVEEAEGRGLGDLLENPYTARLDPQLRALILRWFDQEKEQVQPREAQGQPRLLPDPRIQERPWVFSGGAGELSGILCEPAGGSSAGAPWMIFFNAGGIRRGGPNRLWTKAARELAVLGISSLRFDVRDVGDSDGTSIPHGDLEAMYSESSVEDALRAYDQVRELGAGSVDVTGLCSGAFLGIQVASRRKVRRAVLFNGLAFVWNEEAKASGMTSQIRSSLFNRRRWRRLLSGKIDAKALALAMASKGRMAVGSTIARLAGRPPPDPVEELFRLVANSGTEVQLISSEGDPSIHYVESHVSIAYRPKLTILEGVDHTIRPVWAHPQVVALLRGSF